MWNPLERTSAAISPTAHYTAEVWRRNGLSVPELGTLEGRVFHTAIQPLLALAGLVGMDDLDEFLLARHELIDNLLTEAIASGRVGQVIEIAAGLSPRGIRMTRTHPDLVYIEADLPAMVERKREALEQAGATHPIVALDALAVDGPESLAELAASLDPGKGLAIITEGLLNYFPEAEVESMWRRFAAVLGAFPHGLYLADIVVRDQANDPIARYFSRALGLFVRGEVHIHYGERHEVAATLEAAGFAQASVHAGSEVHDTGGARRTSVIEALA